MMNYCVLVATKTGNTAEALQPFREYESTHQNDQYVQDIDVTDEYLEDYDQWRDEDQTFGEFLDEIGFTQVPFGTSPIIEGEHQFGYYTTKDENNFVVDKVYERTNPNGKWAWWEVGKDLLLDKTGTKRSSCPVAELDVPAMKQRVEAQFRERLENSLSETGLPYDEAVELLQRAEHWIDGRLWREYHRSNKDRDMDFDQWLDRNLLRGHPVQKAIEVGLWFSEFGVRHSNNFILPPHKAVHDVEKYISDLPALEFEAIVCDGEWIETDSLEGLPSDYVITVVEACR